VRAPRHLGAVLLAIAGALPVSSTATAQESACPTTASSSHPPFILPAPYDALPRSSQEFWYGTQALWTKLSTDGTWGTLYRADLHAYRNKLVLWRPGADCREDQRAALTVTVRRLDGEARAVTIPQATNVVGEGIGAAMMTAVDLPTTGCWEFTARYATDSLTFVVSVR
jgi:hypothetical protein